MLSAQLVGENKEEEEEQTLSLTAEITVIASAANIKQTFQTQKLCKIVNCIWGSVSCTVTTINGQLMSSYGTIDVWNLVIQATYMNNKCLHLQ